MRTMNRWRTSEGEFVQAQGRVQRVVYWCSGAMLQTIRFGFCMHCPEAPLIEIRVVDEEWSGISIRGHRGSLNALREQQQKPH